MGMLKELWNDQDFLMKATEVSIVMAWLMFLCLTAKKEKED